LEPSRAVFVGRRTLAVAEIEKRLTRLRRVAEESDDTGIAERIRQLNGELASAKNALSNAQSEVTAKPKLDKEAAKREIWWDERRGTIKEYYRT